MNKLYITVIALCTTGSAFSMQRQVIQHLSTRLDTLNTTVAEHEATIRRNNGTIVRQQAALTARDRAADQATTDAQNNATTIAGLQAQLARSNRQRAARDARHQQQVLALTQQHTTAVEQQERAHQAEIAVEQSRGTRNMALAAAGGVVVGLFATYGVHRSLVNQVSDLEDKLKALGGQVSDKDLSDLEYRVGISESLIQNLLKHLNLCFVRIPEEN